jgi:hypothetical protein
MSEVKRYVLDANVFIEAEKNYYAFDICPGFWRALLRQHEARRVCSIDRIRDELVNDALQQWVRREVPVDFSRAPPTRKSSTRLLK